MIRVPFWSKVLAIGILLTFAADKESLSQCSTAYPFSFNCPLPAAGLNAALTPVHIPDNATLKLTSVTTHQSAVIRDGFYTRGDSGNPVLYIGSNSSCSLNSGNGDDGSQVQAPDGCWFASFPGKVDARQFGADPTFTVDSTTAANAAILHGIKTNAAIYFPAGRYKLSGDLSPIVTSPILAAFPRASCPTIEGDGRGQTIFVQTNATANGFNIGCGGTYGGGIRGMSIHAGSAPYPTYRGSTGIGVRAGGSPGNFHATDFDVQGFATGVKSYTNTYTFFDNFQVRNASAVALHAAGNVAVSGDGAGLWFRDAVGQNLTLYPTTSQALSGATTLNLAGGTTGITTGISVSANTLIGNTCIPGGTTVSSVGPSSITLSAALTCTVPTAQPLVFGGLNDASVGLLVEYASGDHYSSIDLTVFNTGVKIAPATGEFVAHVFIDRVLADTSRSTGWVFDSTNGSIVNITSTGIWGAFTTSGPGLSISGANPIDDIRFISGMFRENGTLGVSVVAGTNILFDGTSIARNSKLTTLTYNGMEVDGTSTVKLTGGTRIGNFSSSAGWSQLTNLAALSTFTGTLDMSGVDLSNPGAGGLPFLDLSNHAVANIVVGQIRPSTAAAGVYTPCTIGVAFGGAAVGVTYSSQICRYQTFGPFVIVEFQLTLTAKGSSTGNAALTGLPITTAAGFTGGSVHISTATNLTGLTGAPQGQVNAAATTANILQSSAAGYGLVTDANFTNTSVLAGLIAYLQ